LKAFLINTGTKLKTKAREIFIWDADHAPQAPARQVAADNQAAAKLVAAIN
jgi:hypothetical protein